MTTQAINGITQKRNLKIRLLKRKKHFITIATWGVPCKGKMRKVQNAHFCVVQKCVIDFSVSLGKCLVIKA
jgi:hypothetical protein